MLRTPEQLEKLFEQSRLSQLKKREKEKEKYRKAQEATKKLLARKCKAEVKQSDNTPIHQSNRGKFYIYGSTTIERNTSEEDLYQTREELMEAEKRGEGKINWEVFDRLVRNFHNVIKRCRYQR